MGKTPATDRPRFEPGDVVLLREDRSEELLPALVRREVEEGLTVIPLSADISSATEWDLLLPSDLLGYRAVAQVWNYGSVLEEQVSEIVARLGADEQDQLNLISAALRDGEAPPDGLLVGPAVLTDEDPRLLAQDAAAETVQPFWEPALALAGAETLGQLVAHRRRALDLDPHELEGAVRAVGWLAGLEQDRLDVRSSLMPTELAVLMHRLCLRASRRLGRITLWTIEGQDPQIARRATDHSQPDDAERYVAEMLEKLEEEQW